MKPRLALSGTVLLCTSTFVLFAASVVLSQSRPSPVAAAEQVQAFYRFHFEHDMGFSPEGVRARSAWLSSQLRKACLSYFAKPTSPDEVPDIDGDPFTNSQEYPKSFEVGTPKVTKATALVPVTFRWADGHSRSVSVALALQGGTWLIDDINYRGEPTLRKLLTSSDGK